MQSPDLLIFYRWTHLLMGAFLMLTGCSSESLIIQTTFPFTVTSQTLPASIKVGSRTSFDVSIVSERTTSSTAYQARWRNLSASPARLILNGSALADNQPVSIPVGGNTAVFIPLDTAATNYQFEVSIIDQTGTTQTVPLSVLTVK